MKNWQFWLTMFTALNFYFATRCRSEVYHFYMAATWWVCIVGLLVGALLGAGVI